MGEGRGPVLFARVGDRDHEVGLGIGLLGAIEPRLEKFDGSVVVFLAQVELAQVVLELLHRRIR